MSEQALNLSSSHIKARARVFVTQENDRLDYMPAESFGDINFITNRDFSNVKNSLNNQSLTDEIKSRLKSVDFHNDWIICTGSPTISAFVFMMIGAIGIKKVKTLRWSNQNRSYSEVVLELPSVGSTNGNDCSDHR